MSLEEKKKIFHDWAYGLFIHYGVYSVYGRGEWMMYFERRDPEEYFSKALPQFHPTYENGHYWAELAKRFAMRYAVLTTRHHEGYFIGDEVIRGFVDGCRENRLGVGLYYSVADWSDPDYCKGPKSPESWERFVQKTHRQIKQIMTDYGRIDYLFYDACPPAATWRVKELHQEIRAMQPGLLISRCGADNDLKSCERHNNGAPEGIWETCDSVNGSWSCNQFDHKWKSAKQLVELFSTNRHNGGNLLLSIGPKADGSVQPEAIRILDEAADWIRANEEALFEVEPHPFDYHDKEITTSRGNIAYLRPTRYYGPVLRVCGIGNKVKRISWLTTGEEVRFEQNHDCIELFNMPPEPEGMPRMLKIELEGLPFGVPNPMKPDCNINIYGE